MRYTILLSFIIILSIMAITPTQQDITPNQVREINVTISGFSFSPSSIEIEAGESVIFNVDNQDGAAHTFTVDGEFDLSLGGNSAGTVEWTAPSTAQTLEFYCRFHGSMTGDIVITEVPNTSETTSSDTTTSSSDTTTSSSDTTSSSSDTTTSSSDTTSETSQTTSSSSSDTSNESSESSGSPQEIVISPIWWVLGFLSIPAVFRRQKV